MGATMNERRRLATAGLIAVAVGADGHVEIGLEGIPVEEDRSAFLEEACAAAAGRRSQEPGQKR